jgi:hypothetical protein
LVISNQRKRNHLILMIGEFRKMNIKKLKKNLQKAHNNNMKQLKGEIREIKGIK